MSFALDLGASEFRSLRNTPDELIARRLPTVYTVLADSPAQRKLLEQTRTPYLIAPGQLIIIGHWAEEVCELQNAPLIPLIGDEGIPSEDPIGRQVCAALITALLPRNDRQPHPNCFAVLPADASQGSETHQFVKRVLKLHGYRLVSVPAALSLTLSQLARAGYSGLTFVFGAETTSCSVTHAGVPLWQATFPGGSRRLEREFATAAEKLRWDREGNKYLDVHGVGEWLRSGKVRLHQPRSVEERVLTTLCRQLLRSFLPQVAKAISAKEVARYLAPGIPILAGGGLSRIPGFAQIFYESLLEEDLPLQNAEIRIAPTDPQVVTRGVLILSLLEAENPLIERLSAAA